MRTKTLRLAILTASSLAYAAYSAGAGTHNASAPPADRTTSTAITDAQAEPRQTEGTMQIRIKAGERTLTARLDDSATARDFAALLPIELTLKDYASTEKIADLPRRLSTEGAPPGVDPAVGCRPWRGTLASGHKPR